MTRMILIYLGLALITFICDLFNSDDISHITFSFLILANIWLAADHIKEGINVHIKTS